MQGNYSRY